MKQQNRKKSKKRNLKPGCIFWIALILLVITLFIVKHKKIQDVLNSTGFLTFFSKPTDKNENSQPDVLRVIEKPKEEKPRQTQPAAEPKQQEVEVAKNEPKELANIPKEKKEPASEDNKKAATEMPSYKVRDSILYFVVINEDGTTQLRKVTRSIKFTDSPLTSTIISLLGGVSSSEINNNYISLIPEKTKLNKLWISEGTAYMDFNENFLFNSFGREGYVGQLKQIVYSATEFSTVKRVQILIDGKTLNYLGSEGIFIGKPISRDSF